MSRLLSIFTGGRSLRPGLIRSSDRDGGAAGSLAEPRCGILSELEKWVLSHLRSVQHELQVVGIAGDLFEVTRPLHGLGRENLQLLRWAAMVHDVGRAVCDETHPQEGAAMIMGDPGAPLSATQRRRLAYLTQYHRGKIPAVGEDEVLLPADDHCCLMTVLALLRAADTLDNRALARKLHTPPQVVFTLKQRSRRRSTLHVTCVLEEVTPKARRVYGRKKKFRLLEELLDCDVVLEVTQSQSMAAVA